MKYKTTSKAVKAGYSRLISVGYCEMAYMLSNRSPIAYASGIYGWNFDVYDIGDIVPGACICTGYRLPKGIEPDFNEMLTYEFNARKDSESADSLLIEFVKQTLEVKS